eukprot:751849-Hanusia_phi.AAC.2
MMRAAMAVALVQSVAAFSCTPSFSPAFTSSSLSSSATSSFTSPRVSPTGLRSPAFALRSKQGRGAAAGAKMGYNLDLTGKVWQRKTTKKAPCMS